MSIISPYKSLLTYFPIHPSVSKYEYFFQCEYKPCVHEYSYHSLSVHDFDMIFFLDKPSIHT